MTERTRTRASGASGSRHVIQMVSRGPGAVAFDSGRRIPQLARSCNPHLAVPAAAGMPPCPTPSL